MSKTCRLLVAEGNTAMARERMRDASGATPGEDYRRVLMALRPGARVDLCEPADADARLPASLDSYDGLVVTGSALNIHRREPESLRQIEFLRAAFAAGLAIFGSCWGLQLGAVAAGGEVAPNPRGREIGVARKIRLTEAGRAHPMHHGRPACFDALAVHLDEVVRLPEGAMVTATNGMSAVQGAEIRVGRSRFWGVQFHPEFALRDIAIIMRGYRGQLVEEGFFAHEREIEHCASDLMSLHDDPGRRDLAWRLGLDRDVLDRGERRREIGNWLDSLDGAEPSRR